MENRKNAMLALKNIKYPYLCLTIQVDGRLVFVGNAANEVIGHLAERLMGRPLMDLLNKDHALNKKFVNSPQDFWTNCGQDFLCAVNGTGNEVKILRLQVQGATNRPATSKERHYLAMDVTELYQHYENLRNRYETLQAKKSLLNPRERQVLESVRMGKLNKQIAKELSVSVRTIENSRSSLIRRLDASHLGEATQIETESKILAQIIKPIAKFLLDTRVLAEIRKRSGNEEVSRSF